MKTTKNNNLLTEESLAIVYKKTWGRLYNVACKYVDKQHAEQLVQNAFVELWFTRNKLRSNDDLEDLLLSLLRKGIYDYFENNRPVHTLTRQSSITEPLILIKTVG